MKNADIKRFLADIKNPSNEFRPAPFWFWNHRLDEKELLHQIDEMAEQGLGGFVMHARHGLHTPYLGSEWMQLTEKCCEKAEKMGLWAWLYDEENWPSGVVGGRLLDDFPQFRMSQIFISDQTRTEGGKEFSWQPERGEGLLYILACRDDLDDWEERLEKMIDLSTSYEEGKGLVCSLPAGMWRVIAFGKAIYRGSFAGGYLDVFNRAATEKFIEYTHAVYTERVGRFYGRCLKGVFTDEPSMYRSTVERSVQWTDSLPEVFEERHGYPLARALLAQFEETGPRMVKYRNDFFETATVLYRENYFRPLFEYCEKHNILSIGHVDFEGEYLSQIREQGDFFETAKYMHWGGCDTLTDTTWPRPGYSTNNLLGVKFASSAAHLLGKPRVMDEAFGVASGWDLNLSTIRWLADWQVAMGANYFIPHAAYYSLEGFRKWECPPDEFYHNPYWKYYRLFTDYLSRLCYLFSNGRHRARVALLSPVAAARGLLQARKLPHSTAYPSEDTSAAGQIQNTLEKVSEALLRHQFDFDLLNEEILQKAEIHKGTDGITRLAVKGRDGGVLEDFELLVLPAAKVISRKTMDKLGEFARLGGKIVFVGGLPEAYTETGIDSSASTAAEGLLRDFPDTVANVKTVGEEFIRALESRVVRDVEAGAAPDFIYLRYEKEEGTCFLLFNTSREESFEPPEITLRASGFPCLVDAETGEINPLEALPHNDNDVTRLRLAFAPQQSRVVLISKRQPDIPAFAKAQAARLQPIEFKDNWTFRLDSDNYLPLADWSLKTRGWSDGHGWLNYHHSYETDFNVKDLPESLYLLADGVMRQERYHGYQISPAEIEVNGRKIDEFREGTHYDRLVPEAEIAHLINLGTNTIRVHTRGGMAEAAAMRQPLVLAGRFALEKEGENWLIAAPRTAQTTGSWAEQGYPFFSGSASYEQTLTIPDEYSGKPLRLVFEGIADLVDVRVNGRQAGVRAWPPWEIPVGEFIMAGENRFAFKVTNTLHNLFMCDPRASGLIASIRIETY
ncbi:MAG: glycosyl hydrolase [Planctomycetota bacterium]